MTTVKTRNTYITKRERTSLVSALKAVLLFTLALIPPFSIIMLLMVLFDA